MKNSAEHCFDPHITDIKPTTCLRVTKPSCPQPGQASTAQKGSSRSPISPAFSSTKMVPGSICSGIHSLRMLSSPIMCPPQDLRSPTTSYSLMTNGTVSLPVDCARRKLRCVRVYVYRGPPSSDTLALEGVEDPLDGVAEAHR